MTTPGRAFTKPVEIRAPKTATGWKTVFYVFLPGGNDIFKGWALTDESAAHIEAMVNKGEYIETRPPPAKTFKAKEEGGEIVENTLVQHGNELVARRSLNGVLLEEPTTPGAAEPQKSGPKPRV